MQERISPLVFLTPRYQVASPVLPTDDLSGEIFFTYIVILMFSVYD